MNTPSKVTSIVVLALCSVCAFATEATADQIAGPSAQTLSLNPQPLPPHPDTVSPRPQPRPVSKSIVME